MSSQKTEVHNESFYECDDLSLLLKIHAPR